MIKIIEKHPFVALFITVSLMLFTHLNLLDVSIMEARNFISAREMISDNNWLLPTLNGEPRYQKPPLPTWITAVFGMIFGIKNIYALRFPAMFMVFVLAIEIYFLSNKLVPKKQLSLINALIAVTSFYIFAIPIEEPWDIYTHTFMLGGLYFLFLFFKDEKYVWKNAILGGILIGFSIMSKGPVSLYALLLPFIISYGIAYKFENLKRKIIPLILFIFLFLLIGYWWYVYVKIKDPNTLSTIVQKETGNWASYHIKPFYYYWDFFIQSGIWTIPAFVSLIYPYLKNKVIDLKAYKFTWLWTIIAVILVSLIPEKKPRYLMPVLIPLSLNTGFYIFYLIQNFKDSKSLKITLPAYFNFSLIAVISILLPAGIYFATPKDSISFWPYYALTAVCSLLIGIAIITNLLKKKIKNVFYLNVAFMVSLLLFGSPLIKTIMTNKNYNSIEKLSSKTNYPVYFYNGLSAELIWSYGKKIKIITADTSINEIENKFYLAVKKSDILSAKQKFSRYTFQQIDVYNNNSTRNSERLIRYLFLVSK